MSEQVGYVCGGDAGCTPLCGWCGGRGVADLLCDGIVQHRRVFVFGVNRVATRPVTCDSPICSTCTTRWRGVDLCPGCAMRLNLAPASQTCLAVGHEKAAFGYACARCWTAVEEFKR